MAGRRRAGTAWTALVAAALVVSGLGLTGCAADATSSVRDFLASDREADDALPPTAVTDGQDAETSRLVGTLDGTTYYLTDFVDPRTGEAGICVILVAADDTEFSNSACGNAVGLWTIGSETGGARIVEKTDPHPKGGRG